VIDPRFQEPPWELPDSGEEPSDEACAQLVDLIYALGDFVAARYDDRISRYYRQRQREEQSVATSEPGGAQLDLFHADLLDPF
jgi:hypothetical protein